MYFTVESVLIKTPFWSEDFPQFQHRDLHTLVRTLQLPQSVLGVYTSAAPISGTWCLYFSCPK